VYLRGGQRGSSTCACQLSTSTSILIVLKLATEFRQPSAINVGRYLFGCRVHQASLMRNFTLSCLPWTSSEDLKKNTLLLSDSYSSLIVLGGSHFDQDSVYEYLKTYSTLTNKTTFLVVCKVTDLTGCYLMSSVLKILLCIVMHYF